NGWKIANPALLARLPEEELDALMRGYGYEPLYVTGHEPASVHQQMAAALDAATGQIRAIQEHARLHPGTQRRRHWPMIVLRTPKGWTGPAVVDGLPVEGTWRAHQVPLAEVRTNPEHLRQLEDWLRSYKPAKLLNAEGGPREGVLGDMLRDVMRLNAAQQNFRIFGPDETESNRLGAVLEVTGKTWEEDQIPVDQHLAVDGRVVELLSEHTCQGWLEGYLLTGRHGLFSCYEAFIH